MSPKQLLPFKEKRKNIHERAISLYFRDLKIISPKKNKARSNLRINRLSLYVFGFFACDLINSLMLTEKFQFPLKYCDLNHFTLFLTDVLTFVYINHQYFKFFSYMLTRKTWQILERNSLLLTKRNFTYYYSL